MNDAMKGPLLVGGLVMLAAIVFGVQAAMGTRWKKGYGGYSEEEMDDTTRAFYKWVAIVALVISLAIFGYTFIALR